MQAHSMCEINVKGCTTKATEIHHAKGRIGKLLNDTLHFRATCRNCHEWAEANPKEAKQIGASVSRLHN